MKKSKNRIIRINEISDIDTSKISVYDLNNRYIDALGNIFGLRYNRPAKKVEIIKLMRIHNEDAAHIRHEMIKKKISETERDDNGIAYDEYRDYGIDLDEDSEDKIKPEDFIDKTLTMMQTHGERLKGIINNINKSNIFPKENKNISIELEDIFRSIEIDAVQRFEKILTYQRELTNYPRSVLHYQSKMDKQGRDIIDRISANSEKTMEFIYYYEMINSIKDVYRHLQKLIGNLLNFIMEKDVDDIKITNTFARQSFQDAVTSIDNTIEEVEKILEEIGPVEKFIINPENL